MDASMIMEKKRKNNNYYLQVILKEQNYSCVWSYRKLVSPRNLQEFVQTARCSGVKKHRLFPLGLELLGENISFKLRRNEVAEFCNKYLCSRWICKLRKSFSDNDVKPIGKRMNGFRWVEFYTVLYWMTIELSDSALKRFFRILNSFSRDETFLQVVKEI